MFGHKVADLIGTVAAILPGAHNDDNAPIMAGHLIETDNKAAPTASRSRSTMAGSPRTMVRTASMSALGSVGRTNSTLVTETNTTEVVDPEAEAA